MSYAPAIPYPTTSAGSPYHVQFRVCGDDRRCGAPFGWGGDGAGSPSCCSDGVSVPPFHALALAITPSL
jgi:hypothetical protein